MLEFPNKQSKHSQTYDIYQLVSFYGWFTWTKEPLHNLVLEPRPNIQDLHRPRPQPTCTSNQQFLFSHRHSCSFWLNKWKKQLLSIWNLMKAINKEVTCNRVYKSILNLVWKCTFTDMSLIISHMLCYWHVTDM